MSREAKIKALFEDLVVIYDRDTRYIDRDEQACVDLRNKLDVLLSWHKWPDEPPTSEGEAWVYYPIKEPGEEDYWVVMRAQHSSWRTWIHGNNPFGWWDEDTDHWTPCVGVTHWMEIERPEPPGD